jgi:hypothetical protein
MVQNVTTFLRPAGRPLVKRPYGRFRGGLLKNVYGIFLKPYVEWVFPENFSHLAQAIWKWQPFKVKQMKTIFENSFRQN